MENVIIKKADISEADLLESMLSDVVENNRRKFLKRGGVVAAAMAMAGTWMGQPSTVSAADDGRTDVQFLQESYTLEQQTVNTYTTVASQKGAGGEDLISGVLLDVTTRFKVVHKEHADRFKDIIVQLGGTVPADTILTTLSVEVLKPKANSQLTSAAGIVRYALGVEVYLMKLYVDYFRYCEDQRARRVFLDIAPNQGAHVAILRAALKRVLSAPTDYDNIDEGKAIVPHIFVSQDAPVF